MMTKTTEMRRKNPFQGIALFGYTLLGHIDSAITQSLKIQRLQQFVTSPSLANEQNLDRLHKHLRVELK